MTEKTATQAVMGMQDAARLQDVLDVLAVQRAKLKEALLACAHAYRVVTGDRVTIEVTNPFVPHVTERTEL